MFGLVLVLVLVLVLPFLNLSNIVATISLACDVTENHPAEMMLDGKDLTENLSTAMECLFTFTHSYGSSIARIPRLFNFTT